MNNIKELREKTGLSQRQFAEKFSISIKTLQNWEQGYRNPPPYVPNLIEKVLKSEGLIE